MQRRSGHVNLSVIYVRLKCKNIFYTTHPNVACLHFEEEKELWSVLNIFDRLQIVKLFFTRRLLKQDNFQYQT